MGAVFSASFKAALVGSAIVTTTLTLGLGLPSVETGGDFVNLILGVAVFGFVIAFFLGLIATSLMLTIIGVPIAYLARNTLATEVGLSIAMGSAVMLSAITAALIGGLPFILVVLPFSIPAALFFRRDLLLERSLP